MHGQLNVKFCVSVGPSVCAHGTTRFPLDRVSWKLLFVYCSNCCWEQYRLNSRPRNMVALGKYDKLMAIERKIARKIFGSTRTDDGCWRIETDREVNCVLKWQNIIGFVKRQRLKLLGHVERIAEDNIVRKIKRWKPMSKRPIGRHKTRWQGDVLEVTKSINRGNWKKVVQSGESWNRVLQQDRALYRLWRFLRRRKEKGRRGKRGGGRGEEEEEGEEGEKEEE